MTKYVDENFKADMMRLSTRTDDELYEELGSVILGDGLGVGPQDPEGHRKFGRQWFSGRVEEFTKLVCTNDSVMRIHNLGRDEQFLSIATVFDAIAGILGQPAALVVSTLIVRLGLGRFCRSYW